MNRMKGKKMLAALGFFSIVGVAGGCSDLSLMYVIR